MERRNKETTLVFGSRQSSYAGAQSRPLTIAHVTLAYHRNVRAELAQQVALDAAWCGARGIVFVPAWVDINGVERARNHAVKIAEHVNADLLMMQDADTWSHGACVGTLLQTLNRHGAAAVAAAYALRNRNGTSVEPSMPGQTYLAEKAGTGIMMIDMRDVADIPRPLFATKTSADGLRMELGEDIYFCRLLRDHGKLVAVDYTLTTSHATQDVITLSPSNAIVERKSAEHGDEPGHKGNKDGR